jgi:nitrate reductase gamma subunit
MHDIYNFVSGPLVWVAFIVFIGGCLFRLIRMISQVKKKEPFILTYMSLKYSLRSIGHWIIPFGTVNMRRHPVMTIVTFAFHICLLVTPIFLLAHVVLWDEAWNIRWITLPDGVADIMTFIVIAACIFFLVRRLKLAEVRFVTSFSDFVLLIIVATPFISGFIAYHQWFNYQVAIIIHIVSGEIMLMAIPFTRLSHMIFSPFTRAYMGSEFGGIRHARDW